MAEHSAPIPTPARTPTTPAVTAEDAPAPVEPRVVARQLLEEGCDRLSDALAALDGQADPERAAGLVGQASTLTGRALYFLRQVRG